MSRVFVINEQLTVNKTSGALESKFDLRTAREYGQVVHLLGAGRFPDDPGVVVDLIDEKLEGYTDDDYLLPCGHPFAIGVAFALAAQRTGGFLQYLVWDRQRRAYYAQSAKLPGFD